METLIGFAVGFYLGTREGPDGVRKLKESWTSIRESSELQTFVGGAVKTVLPIARELARSRN